MQAVALFTPQGYSGHDEPSPEALTREVERSGRALGFARVGVTSAAPLLDAAARLTTFRERGYAGAMQYLEQGDRHDPSALLPDAKSVISVAFAHGDPELIPLRRKSSGPAGIVARYARGDDYHLLLKTKLYALGRELSTFAGRPMQGRVCVDTAPLLERELALRSGLGFQGKSTLFIAPGAGSYVLLGELIVDLQLAPTQPSTSSGCGSCRACLDACPSAAFPAEYTLDARRCISYLTIEHSGTFPHELRRAMGARVFGCDACQEVCPYNASPSRPHSSELGMRDALTNPDLVALLELGAARYRTLVKRTALRRASRATLQRNAAIALGNSGDESAIAPLTRALLENPTPLVRAHAAWALGELAPHITPAARAALERAAAEDDSGEVRAEARAVLDSIGGGLDGAGQGALSAGIADVEVVGNPREQR